MTSLANFTWIFQAALIGTVIAVLTYMVREQFNGEWRNKE